MQISPDEVSDNEGDPNSGIEVADFDDPLSPNSESKRGMGGRSGADASQQPSSSAMKACEAALAAALTSNKAYTRKNEELAAELDDLREKYERALTSLRQQRELADLGGSSREANGALEQDLEASRALLEEQETKLQQAAEFVAFQEEQLQELRDEVERLSQQGQPNEQTALVEQMQQQLSDGAAYVDHLQGQLDEATEELGRLRSAGSSAEEELATLREEITVRDDKINAAADFVKYQEEKIAELTAEVQALTEKQQQLEQRAVTEAEESAQAALREQVAALEERLAQGAVYCEALQGQVDASALEAEAAKREQADLQQRLQAAEQALHDLEDVQRAGAPAPDTGKGAGDAAAAAIAMSELKRELEQSRELCASYSAQMLTGAEYVEELKGELVDAQKRVQRLEKLQATSKGRGATGGYDANTERISNLEDELAAAFAELEKVRARLAAGGASQAEVNFYKTQNQTYLVKLHQGAEYVDSLQAQLQRAEDALTWQNNGGNLSPLSAAAAASGRSVSVVEGELRECKAICTKFGLKLEQAAQLIEELEAQRDEARDAAAEGRTAVDALKKATSKVHELTAVLGAKDELLRVATTRGSLSKADLDQVVDRVGKELAHARAAGDSAVKEVSRLQRQLHAATTGGSEGRKKLLDMEEILSAAANRRRCAELELIVAELRRTSDNDLPADHVIQELIEFKMKFAAAATDVDHERRKAQDALLRLQAAGKRIAQLEASLARAQEAANEPKGVFAFLTRSRSSSQATADNNSGHGGGSSVAGSVAGSEAGYRDSRMRSAPLPRHGQPNAYAPHGGGGAGAGRGLGGGGVLHNPSTAGVAGAGRPVAYPSAAGRGSAGPAAATRR